MTCGCRIRHIKNWRRAMAWETWSRTLSELFLQFSEDMFPGQLRVCFGYDTYGEVESSTDCVIRVKSVRGKLYHRPDNCIPGKTHWCHVSRVCPGWPDKGHVADSEGMLIEENTQFKKTWNKLLLVYISLFINTIKHTFFILF